MQVGAWSKKHPELASKIVVATKFGETFDTVTGETSVDLSADAAIRSVTLTDMRTGRRDVAHTFKQRQRDCAAGPTKRQLTRCGACAYGLGVWRQACDI